MPKAMMQATMIALTGLILAGCAASPASTPSVPPVPPAPVVTSASATPATPSALPTPTASATRAFGVQPSDPTTQLRGAKVIQQGATLRLYLPGVAKTSTVGVRYVPVGTKDPWNVKPVGYGISIAREGNTFTIGTYDYNPIPAGDYQILIVDSAYNHAVVTATVSGK